MGGPGDKDQGGWAAWEWSQDGGWFWLCQQPLLLSYSWGKWIQEDRSFTNGCINYGTGDSREVLHGVRVLCYFELNRSGSQRIELGLEHRSSEWWASRNKMGHGGGKESICYRVTKGKGTTQLKKTSNWVMFNSQLAQAGVNGMKGWKVISEVPCAWELFGLLLWQKM